eukprot:COSAG04_NODE_4323_length_2156_cov_2.181818_1_plen_161_part_10
MFRTAQTLRMHMSNTQPTKLPNKRLTYTALWAPTRQLGGAMPWVCELCTYRDNADAATLCEVCDGPHPDDAAGAGQPGAGVGGGDDGGAAAAAGGPGDGAAAAAAGPAGGAKRQSDGERKAAAAEPAPLSAEDETWCGRANQAFMALIQLAVLFHVRRAPL